MGAMKKLRAFLCRLSRLMPCEVAMIEPCSTAEFILGNLKILRPKLVENSYKKSFDKSVSSLEIMIRRQFYRNVVKL